MASSSIADQLSALGVVSEPQRTNAGKAASTSSNKKRKPKGKPPHQIKLDHYLVEMPVWGEVGSLQVERGFGFIRSQNSTEDLFFHVTKRQLHTSKDLVDLRLGDPVIFYLGTEPNRPYKPCALRWALVRDLPWEGLAPPSSQAEFDELRRPLLRDMPFEALLKLMQPDWYLRVWVGRQAPCNLNDPLLQSVFFERLATLEVSELAAFTPPPADWLQLAGVQESQKLMLWYLRYSKGTMTPAWEACFQARDNHEAIVVDRYIEHDLPRTDFIVAWVEKIITRGWLTAPSLLRWIGDDQAAAFRHFRQLPVERRLTWLTQWRRHPDELMLLLRENPGISTWEFLLSSVLALDLETDGGHIWELGYARGGEASLLFGRGNGTDLNAAMMQLQAQADAAPLLVGHNIVAWDWPILSRHLHLEPVPLLWDTLLVHYLLEPQAKSYALGGSHHADGDALLAAKLFEKQFKCLPFEFATRVLSGEFLNTSDLLDALALVVDSCSYTRVMPAWLAERRGSHAILVLPARYLTQVDWLPGVTVVSANTAESLPLALLQLDLDLLESALAGEVGRAPAARVLLMVTRRAAAQGIALRYGMLPPWLLEQYAELDLAVRRSCCVPQSGVGIRVAPLPVDVQSILAAGPEAFHLVGFDYPVLVHDQRAKALPQFAEMTKGHGAASLLRLEEPGAGPLWLMADGAARRMEIGGGWRSFRTQLVDKGLIELLPPSDLLQRPVLVTRNDPVLHPGTFDQASYWVEVIRTLIEVRSRHLGAEGVAILLVSSSNSLKLVDLLRVALAEVGLGEIKSEHHSRLTQLQRAQHRQGILVDFLEHWPQWLALARFAEVTLLPVVEALPLEQWFAMSSTQEDTQSLVDENDAKAPAAAAGSFEDDILDEEAEASTADEPPALVSEKGALASCHPVRAGDVLQRAAKLVEDFLSSWLQSSGLAESKQPVVLLDSRLGGQVKALKKFVEPFLLAAAPLPAAQADGLRLVLEPLQIRRELASDDYGAMEKFLVKNWQSADASKGNPIVGFKDSQKPAIQAISSRSSDVLVALPTGEGKSVLFQVPALCRGLRTRRLTLVLSPLKALMRDQVEGLRKKGFAESADFLSGDRPWHEIVDVYQGVMDHRIVLLYVAPERFRSSMFLNVLRQRMEADGVLEYAVVDETHCVNQWGYEFRPDYFYALQHLLSNYRTAAEGEKTPFLLLSATLTASDKVRLRGILGDDSAGQAEALPLLALPERYMPPLRDHIEVIPQRVHGNIWDRDSFTQVLAERVRVIVPYIEAALVNRARTGQRSAVIIFVTRRRHAEELAQALSKATSCQVDYFHAGLNAGAREELLDDFKRGKLDVLVATKAFGMGMDIPDIHWAIHLGPPAYLEDYLQEVGRIGRGEAERKQAQLARLQAILLYSSADFEHIRSLRATSAINLAGIKQFYERICEVAEPAGEQWVAIVPQAGLESKDDPRQKESNPTQVRMLLYWLERAGKLVLRSSVPNLLPVKLYRDVLQRIAREAGNQGKLAKVILEMGEVSELTLQPAKASDIRAQLGARPEQHWLESLLTRLGDMVGLIFGNKPTKPIPSQNPVLAPPSSAVSQISGSADQVGVINLAQIMMRCSFATLGDAMAELATLERHGALELRRQFQFSRRSLGDEPMLHINALFKMIDEAHQELLRRLSDQGHLRFGLSELLQGFTSTQVDDAKRTYYQKAFQWGLITLARMSGISMRQAVEKGEEVIWEVRLSSALHRRAEQRKKTTLAMARNVLALLRSPSCKDSRTVSMRDLIETSQAASSNGRFHEADLHRALNLLSAMQLISLSADLLPMSYVLTLERLNESLDEHKELWDELDEVNRFSELRNDAMEVFANLPSDRQDAFLEGYFAQADVKGLESFLLSQLGEIDSQNDEGLSNFIKDKQEHLRASAVTEFFERYQQSEEPNQWAAMCHPYDQHLLVNAGPGAGKTAVLVGRIVHLIREQHIQPSEIVVLAFNRAVVFEIRKRIKALFGTLGYASYVSRLRVATFHAFAMHELALVDGALGDSVDRKNILGVFVERLATDANFCRQVARDVRCIMVDEFQDVTEDIYCIIRLLQQGSGNKAGIMVIGDDDQDILRWNRPNKAFSEEYFDRFGQNFGGDDLTTLALRVNFRSGAAIVERSQLMIQEILARNPYSKRLKDFPLTARCNQPVSADVKRLPPEGCLAAGSWEKVLNATKLICQKHINDCNGSFAILCRSNTEVAQAYRYLAAGLPDLLVQGGANYRVGDLRHVALWREFIETEMAKQNHLLTDELKDTLIAQFNQNCDIPETRQPSDADPPLQELWNLCCQERMFAHLSDMIDFIDDLQTDTLERLRGVLHERPAQVISTIHKVKGMEYDRVVILPSLSGFGSKATNAQTLAMDAAEEARLFYVGMTRAKRYLTYFVGEREQAWGRRATFIGGGFGSSKTLVGSHEEVGLGWAMTDSVFNPDPDACQNYIERQVRVGDPIILGGRGAGAFKGLFHQGADGKLCQIGFVAKEFGAGCPSSSLRVSAVVRFKPDSVFGLAQSVQQRGWGYVVLVEGQL